MSDFFVVDRITKTFGRLKANDNVSINVKKGTVHAILGENGAGKSTLMNVIFGLYQPDSGSIKIDGRVVDIRSPKQALENGIGMVHQHFMLVGTLSVAENIVLGLEGQSVSLDLTNHAARISKLSTEFGFDIDPLEKVWRLPIGKQQQVEILKLLYRNAEILILDEPTSVLTPSETGPFFEVIKRLKEAGKTILMISHKMEEVFAVADSVSVMRHGKITSEMATAETTGDELARLLIGRDIAFDVTRPAANFRDVKLELNGLCAHDERGVQKLRDVSLQVRGGEILGIAGVDGNGQSELAEVIAGLKRLDAGSVSIDGRSIDTDSVGDRKTLRKLGYVPEDRHHVGLDLQQSVATNLVMRSFDRIPFSKLKLLDFEAIARNAEALVAKYDVRLMGIDQQARFLSGGNQQKLILAREIEEEPEVLVVAQPCKGLDIGAIEFVQKTLLEQRDKGVAILYISTELEHVMEICDRIAVICDGQITGILQPEDADSETLGKLMAGAKLENA